MKPTSTEHYEFEVRVEYDDGNVADHILFEVHAVVAYMKAAGMLASDERLVELTVFRHGKVLATFVRGER